MTPPPSPSLEEQNKIANKMKMKKVAGTIVSLIALAGIIVGVKFGVFCGELEVHLISPIIWNRQNQVACSGKS